MHNEMKEITDIHCHILPYVDDGALRVQESDELLKAQYAQGVRTICATPHLRKGMFETPDETIVLQFERLKMRAAEICPDVSLFLSREYHCDRLFRDRLVSHQVMPLGNGSYLLSEFSYRHSEEQIHDYIRLIQDSGFKPLIAHAERYPAICESTEQVEKLIDMGAMIQMNVSSILGREGRKQASWCKKLLKAHLVHVVASDAHDPEERPVELGLCAEYLERKFGAELAEELLCINPFKILNIDL